jgi:thiamine-phosphate pyrophosphorylase
MYIKPPIVFGNPFSIYLVANRPSFSDPREFFSKIMDSVRGGASCVQLRDHESDLNHILETASKLKELLEDTPLFVNTKPSYLLEVTREINPAGVFLEERVSYAKMRELLGPAKIIGVSIKTMEDMKDPELEEIDYLSVKVASSKKTCPQNDHLWGLEGLHKIRSLTEHPIVAIGGLDLNSAWPVCKELNPERDGIAMAGGLMRSENPYATAQAVEKIWRETRPRC